MKKSQGIITLVAVFLVIAGLGFMSAVGVGSSKVGAISTIKQGLDLAGGVSITYQVKGEETPTSEDMSDTVYKLQQRVEKYSTEAQVYQQGTNRINIEIPGVTDANAILEELGQPGSLYFISQTDSDGNQNYTYGATGYTLNKTIEELTADGSVVLLGTDVDTATAETQKNTLGNAENVVALSLTAEGTTKFATATKKAFAAGESIGIYYDGAFISVPGVDAEITTGQAVINGMADFTEAETLASQIRIGGLKLELEELSSNVVGAQLGEEAISTSLKAAAIGVILVIIFMIVMFFIPGLSASLGLIIYTGLMIFLLNAFEITLTLPGIAGIILSIGMAVDANVIVFARIRDEIADGKAVKSALKTGFSRALPSIIDGNVTILISAVVLALKGSGTVKSFAYTLAIGVVLSLFTALFVTHTILRALYAIGFKDVKFYGKAKHLKPIPFIKTKYVFFAISGALILAGFVAMGVHKINGNTALNYSLEFVGGTSTEVTFDKEYSLDEIDKDIIPYVEKITGDSDVQTQKVEGTNEVVFKTRSLDLTEREALNQVFADNFNVDTNTISSSNISSTISKEMTRDAIWAVIISNVLILMYIWFRFKDIRFATAAILALVHDVLVVLTCYAILRLSIGSGFIAVMLTIIGYSMNDTVVIFDRIRENLRNVRVQTPEALEEVSDISITQTLTRSINTHLTVFIMVLLLYILGVATLKDFALPLMVGVVTGAYSSICNATPIWYLWKRFDYNKANKGKNVKKIKAKK